ncbi:DUF7507 domain-containing protein [Salibaculum griseiflavum]|uniref:OmpA-like domain-containing protein n=1 Tax=Salibaculum griseiflavum TaxID=1914409 RepID=A0A2V1NZ63_9RHOB|nr:OmpA family protein [Salibaculum griseiflavum]PWG15601.1 hypothetical protein DFK10_16035 [Salibaculum griseiflavum]
MGPDEYYQGVVVWANAGINFNDDELRGFDITVDYVDSAGQPQTLSGEDVSLGVTTGTNDPKTVTFASLGGPEAISGITQFTISDLTAPSGDPFATFREIALLEATPPEISLVKTGVFNDANNNGVVDVGDTVTYTYVVTNTGIPTVFDVNVTEPGGASFSGTGTVPVPAYSSGGGNYDSGTTTTDIRSGETVTFSATYTLTAADVSAGSLTNQATASGTDFHGVTATDLSGTANDNDTATVTSFEFPALTLLKSADTSALSNPAQVGDQITYTFTLENTGNVDLTGVSVSDDSGFTGEDPFPTPSFTSGTGGATATSIPAGETAIYTAIYTLTQADVDAGEISNQAVASADELTDDVLSDNDDTADGTAGDDTSTGGTGDDTGDANPTLVALTASPELTLVKTGTLNDDDGTAGLSVGDTISYTFAVENTGNVTVENVEITDNDAALTGSAIASLAPGDVDDTTYTASYTLTQTDVDAGTFENTATATGDSPTGTDDVTATDTDTQTFDNDADLVTAKTVDKATADEGDTVTYTVTVTNDGPAEATNVTLTDELPAGLTATAANGVVDAGSYDAGTGVWTIPSLADQASATLTLVGTVDAGQGGNTIENTVAEASTPDQTDPNTGTDSTSAQTFINSADLSIAKVVDNATPNVGDTVTFTLTAANAGPSDATGVVVTEQLEDGYEFTSASASSGSYDPATGEWSIGALANGDSATLALEATVLASGTYTNTASITGNEEDPSTENDVIDPPVETNPVVAPELEDDIAISNDLGEPVTVDVLDNDQAGDNPLDPTSVQLLDENGDPVSELEVAGEGTWTVDPATGEITFTPEAGFTGDATPVDYTATDDQGTPAEKPATLEIGYTNPISELEVVLTADNGALADGAQEGDIITYTFEIENTGNVELGDVQLSDLEFTGSGDLPDAAFVSNSGDSPTGTLMPGEKGTYTISYALTKADIIAGEISLKGDAKGVSPTSGVEAFATSNQMTVTLVGLIDLIAEPLTDILESDLRETVAKQSRLFEDIARGARDRLSDRSADRCVRALNSRVEEDPILFATARAELRPESRELVDELAEILASCEDARIEIGGHTDSRGGDDYNQRLSQSRVETVLRALAERGVDSERLVARGYGEREPVADNATAEGRAQNRRVEFRVNDVAPMREECGQVRPFDVDGSAEASAGRFNTDGTFGEEFYNCKTDQRQIIRGEFSLSHDKDLGTQGMLTGTLQRERRVSEDHLRGYFLGAYASRTSVTSRADGQINGYGLYGGLYGAARMNQDIYLDYYLAGSAGHHSFDLRFSEGLSEGVDADGSYQYMGLFGGMSVSGEVEYGETRVTPRAGLHLTYATAADADVTASIPGRSESGTLSLDDQKGIRFFAEIGLDFGDEVSDEGYRNLSRSWHVAPRLYCDMAIGSSSETACGIGAGLEYRLTNRLNGTDWGVDMDLETSGDVTRGSLGMFHEQSIFNEQGKLRFGTDVSQQGKPHLSFDLNVEW